MKITVNFKPIEFEGASLRELLALYRFNPEKISLLINDSRVPIESIDSIQLKEGDVLDIGRA